MAVPVRVLRGDDLIEPSAAPTMLKIDVEGFELHVLRGFERLLRENHPLVVTETVVWYLRRAGTELSQLHDFMEALGYKPFDFPLVRHGLSHGVAIKPIEKATAEQAKNTLWIHPDSPHAERLRSLKAV